MIALPTDRTLPEFDLNKPPATSRFISVYDAFYSMVFPQVRHFLGMIRMKKYSVAAQCFIPESPDGAVVVLHGYLDHGGIMRNVVDWCITHRYTSALIDLPGHGLSSGKRASIDDFSDYADIVDEFLMKLESFSIKRPFHFIGHSTGCSVLLEYLYTKDISAFDRIVFLSPLVRTTMWRIFNLFYFWCGRRFSTLPRPYQPRSNDPEFSRFHRNDPLRIRRISVDWFAALKIWNEKMRSRESLDRGALILQGTNDTVVDGKYNIPFLKKKLPSAKVCMIDNAMHQLQNEAPLYRKKVLEEIDRYVC